MTVEGVSETLGYNFKNEALLAEALTHASIAGHRLESNERMEFLGDAILGFVVSEFLYDQYPEYLEGELTKIKSAVVSRRVCAQISTDLKLGEMLNLGKGVGDSELPRSIAAAVLESIIAALYLDGGLEPTRDFIIRCIEPHIREAAESNHQHNFKSVLQQYAQRQLTSMPAYVLLDEKGPDHCKCFEVCVGLDGRRFTPAWANSKKEAEQQAALNALCELGLARTDQGPGRILLDDHALNGGSLADPIANPEETGEPDEPDID